MTSYVSRVAVFLLAAAATAGTAPALAAGVTVLDTAAVPEKGAEGINVNELSGLAWDADEKLLYAVSDDGILHHFRIAIEGDAIGAVEPVFAARLSTTGAALVNAEGLAVINGGNGKSGDSELLIAFEDGPSLQRFSVEGKPLETLALPEPLSDPAKYNADNSRLEAVAFDAERGVLTAPEEPMADKPGDTHSIYALDGSSWTFKAFQPKRSNLKAIEPMADGRMLVLERTREQKGGTDKARLRIVDLAACGAEAECAAVEATGEDPRLDDNFEGMARVSDDLFLLVTDKKKRDNPPTGLLLVRVR